MNVLRILCTVTIIFYICNASDPQKLHIANEQGFVIFLKINERFGTIKECKAIFGNEEYKIDVKPGSQQEIVTKRGEIISPYSSTECGIRVIKISTATEGKWYLKMFNENNKEVSETFDINVLPKPDFNTFKRENKALGLGTVKCSNTNPRSCRIRNNEGFSSDRCESSVIFREPSTWYCQSMNWGTMEESKETIEVRIEKRVVSSIAYVEETDIEHKLSCNFSKKIPGCRAEFPDKKNQLFILENLHHEKYSTGGTDLANGYCVLSIKKPITGKEEGIWKIYQLDTSATPSALKGCILYLGEKKNLIEKSFHEENKDVNKIEVILSSTNNNNVLIDDTFSITCQVPFVVDQCYLKDPLDKIYFQNEIDFEYSRTLGMCNFRNLPKLHGRWICGLYGSDYEKEIIREFEVKIISKYGEVVRDKISALSGDTIDLLCRSAMSQPITECSFTNPNGKVYLVSNSFNNFDDSRMSYFGDGLSNGYCGIKIKYLNNSEFGKWTCQFSGPQTEGFFSLEVHELATNLGTIIGASVGASAALFIAIIGAFILVSRRKRNRTAAQRNGEETNEERAESTSL